MSVNAVSIVLNIAFSDSFYKSVCMFDYNLFRVKEKILLKKKTLLPQQIIAIIKFNHTRRLSK